MYVAVFRKISMYWSPKSIIRSEKFKCDSYNTFPCVQPDLRLYCERKTPFQQKEALSIV